MGSDAGSWERDERGVAWREGTYAVTERSKSIDSMIFVPPPAV